MTCSMQLQHVVVDVVGIGAATLLYRVGDVCMSVRSSRSIVSVRWLRFVVGWGPL